MKIKTITTYNNKLYKEYAYRFKETYNWPFPLKIYNEDECMMKTIPELKEFVEPYLQIEKIYRSHKHLSKGQARKRRTISVYAQKDPYR